MRKSVHSEAQKALGNLLRDARDKADMTQSDLAKELGKRQSFVAKIEIGERRVDVVELVQIARALNADPVKMLRALARKFA
ncbi:MAG: helix-turn-helix transcriptional regulator [Xanthobacteraceae bacterium]|nr:helix-turn-helix transcriptional regulator [Xanthobacteraceae bacterium]